MRKHPALIVLISLTAVFLILGYIQYISGYIKVAVMGYFNSTEFISHRNTYCEALHLYMEDHPYSRLKLLEVDISHKTTPDFIRKIVSDLNRKGVKVIIAPFSSPITDSVSEEAEKYGMIVLSPFSRYTRSRENLIPMIPSLTDFTKVAVDFARNNGFKKVIILRNSQHIVDRKMAYELIEGFSNVGIDAVLKENLEEYDMNTSNLIVIVKSFPVFLSKDLAVLSNALTKPTVLIVSTYLNPFENLFGKYLNKIYAIDYSFYYTERGKEFVMSYKKLFGRSPSPGVVAMYDTLSLIEKFMRENEDVDIRSLRNLRFYRGFMGDIPLDGTDMSNLLTLVIFKEVGENLVKVKIRE